MRLIIIFITALVLSNTTFAQVPTYQQKLYYTCKIWGFVKYYHSNVSNCNINWDSVLLASLPAIKNTVTKNEFNDALDTMLVAAGPMALSSTYFPDTLAPELKRNRNFGWINDANLRADVQTILDTIKNNFRPHIGCYVKDNTYPYSTSFNYGGLLLFPHDTILLDTSVFTNYPDEYNRLSVLFKYWNLVNYFDPYTYGFDQPMDTILYNHIMSFDTVSNPEAFNMCLRSVFASFDDESIEAGTYYRNFAYPGHYNPQIMLSYIQGKYVVVKSGVAGVPVGQAVVSINGLSATQWEDSLRPYISAGNISIFRYKVGRYMLAGNTGTTVQAVFADTAGMQTPDTLMRDTYITSGWFQSYYPADSLSNINWNMMSCQVGYINNNVMLGTDVNDAYNALGGSAAIVIDLRNFAVSNTVWELANLMYPTTESFAKNCVPDVTYPGTFSWQYDALGYPQNSNPYNGTVILLVNELTAGSAEYGCMIMQNMRHIIVGSQTAGADGNVSYFLVTQDMQTDFPSLGVFYPNGDSTQRIGMVPDVVVRPTIAGIMQGRDEVLEKALTMACSIANSIPMIAAATTKINVYPNPADALVNIDVTNVQQKELTVAIMDIAGKTISSQEIAKSGNDVHTSINVSTLSPGMYFVKIQAGSEQYVRKIVKE
ncbi:MAG: T9SS type A sorting domain-containing protein [Flavipsychrobacter sp.]|nr:T9SS type A sorting domain-containing protein [Flavipsychrobacter sp.]